MDFSSSICPRRLSAVYAFAPVVQWIGRKLAELVIQVRLLSGANAYTEKMKGRPAQRDNIGSIPVEGKWNSSKDDVLAIFAAIFSAPITACW